MVQGKLYILSAPAGTGKTTLIKKVIQKLPNFVQSVSYTTRSPRIGEQQGVDYFFVSADEFQKMIETHAFLENALIYGEHYGTSEKWVKEKLKEGLNVVLVIDTQGKKKVLKRQSATTIFVLPPSVDELHRRLIGRGTESEQSMMQRLKRSEQELALANTYDYQIVNADIETAAEELIKIFLKE